MLDLNAIQATLTERKYMRQARAFRAYLDLPQNAVLAAALTALIDRQVNVTIQNNDISVEMHPALVVDVTSRSKKFGLVIETVHESQNGIGPNLTAITGEKVVLSIRPVGEKTPEQAAKRGDIDEQALKGLHSAFFKNKLFYEFLSRKTGETVDDPISCKAIYKAMMQVSSCREIDQTDYNACLQDFNKWLATRGQGA